MKFPNRRRVGRVGRPVVELTGAVLHDLTVLREAGRDARGRVTWRVRCRCGREVTMRGDVLRAGAGMCRECARAKRWEGHGSAAWRAMGS